ncbi:glycosyltransferase family 2 protein [Vibrio alginolyticus]|uniref:glycosyltransferase family 2 protein n=1 Tax=Vibrio TaxID=662 RepID=UPI001110515B|nr:MULTISPECIES: glycosyltransferase family A protein [Vibrio]EJA7360928.1 glycosyltransferase family 2 protein [Vibrio alginolyticus]MCA2450171.1 glycosyltransferase family 2 protein [Vibrio alginolyticus]MCA2473699.1 glycosyltransferase family 2 protein [Vibrio alginolyticus]MDW2153726.1 glycosyltransferase family A protein [Vibrio sp. 2092]MDW2230176.1 glycosyltransferase family A protein [Vibrio sp. 2091]
MNNKVSVLCICYNHQEYIRTSIESILSQESDFDIELIIYDDCSTDNSREIIDEIVANYKGKIKIKCWFPKENQYSKGITVVSFLFPLIEGDYISICEGDDYWIDNKKLQKQYDLLEENRDIDACFHPALTLIDDRLEDKRYGYVGDSVYRVSDKDVVMKGGSMMPLASILFRAKPFLDIVSKNREFFHYECYHSILQAVITLGRGALYTPDKMSVYRSMHEGSWSLQQSLDQKKRDREFKAANQRIWKLNKIYNNKYFGLFLKLYYKRNIKFYKDKLKCIYK